VWSEAGAQPHLEEALNIGGFGYPVSFLCCLVLFLQFVFDNNLY